MRGPALCDTPAHRFQPSRVKPATWGATICVLASLVLSWGAVAQPLLAGGPPDRAPAKAPPQTLVHGLHGEAERAWTQASSDSRQMVNWVRRSGDHGGLPFVLIDKRQAQVFVFSGEARLIGAAPALLGLASGDDPSPGIGQKPLSSIQPHERTTPAGRFVAAMAKNLSGDPILWVDYDTSVSLHALRGNNPREQRARRLTSPSAQDNRISFGCINVAPTFFDAVVSTAFQGTEGVVYVLPDTRSLVSVFGPHGFAPSPD